jgi:hypothetical protein
LPAKIFEFKGVSFGDFGRNGAKNPSNSANPDGVGGKIFRTKELAEGECLDCQRSRLPLPAWIERGDEVKGKVGGSGEDSRFGNKVSGADRPRGGVCEPELVVSAMGILRQLFSIGVY